MIKPFRCILPEVEVIRHWCRDLAKVLQLAFNLLKELGLQNHNLSLLQSGVQNRGVHVTNLVTAVPPLRLCEEPSTEVIVFFLFNLLVQIQNRSSNKLLLDVHFALVDSQHGHRLLVYHKSANRNHWYELRLRLSLQLVGAQRPLARHTARKVWDCRQILIWNKVHIYYYYSYFRTRVFCVSPSFILLTKGKF